MFLANKCRGKIEKNFQQENDFINCSIKKIMSYNIPTKNNKYEDHIVTSIK